MCILFSVNPTGSHRDSTSDGVCPPPQPPHILFGPEPRLKQVSSRERPCCPSGPRATMDRTGGHSRYQINDNAYAYQATRPGLDHLCFLHHGFLSPKSLLSASEVRPWGGILIVYYKEPRPCTVAGRKGCHNWTNTIRTVAPSLGSRNHCGKHGPLKLPKSMPAACANEKQLS